MVFWHGGLLTADIMKTIDFFCTASGSQREAWTIMDINFGQSNMVIGDGGKLRAAFGRVGGNVVELLQPLDDNSFHAQSLRKRGPGFHHNAYICQDNMDAKISALLDAGSRIVWEFSGNGEHACYIESPEGTALIELINCCPFMPD